MSTKNPRINITLKQADYEVIKRLSELTGSSMSKTINEYLDLIVPTLERVVENLELIQKSDENFKRSLVEGLDQSLVRLEALNHYALSEYDNLNEKLSTGGAAADGQTRGDRGGR